MLTPQRKAPAGTQTSHLLTVKQQCKPPRLWRLKTIKTQGCLLLYRAESVSEVSLLCRPLKVDYLSSPSSFLQVSPPPQHRLIHGLCRLSHKCDSSDHWELGSSEQQRPWHWAELWAVIHQQYVSRSPVVSQMRNKKGKVQWVKTGSGDEISGHCLPKSAYLWHQLHKVPTCLKEVRPRPGYSTIFLLNNHSEAHIYTFKKICKWNKTYVTGTK